MVQRPPPTQPSLAQLTAAIDEIESKLGPVDVLVANAGIGAYGAFADVDPELMERLVRVNVLGTMHAIRAVVPGMISRRRGHIVTIGSIAGRIGSPFEALYSATKFAQGGAHRSPIGRALAVRHRRVDRESGCRRHGLLRCSRARVRPGAPRQIPPAQVAAAVIKAVEADQAERFVPGWFHQAVVFRHLVPPLFRWGTRRSFRAELAADEAAR